MTGTELLDQLKRLPYDELELEIVASYYYGDRVGSQALTTIASINPEQTHHKDSIGEDIILNDEDNPYKYDLETKLVLSNGNW